MISVNYPDHRFRLKEDKGKKYVFDELRKAWLLLTPEEWVRQHFVHYLIDVKKYPATLIAVEKRIRLYELNKRFDILVYDDNHHPWMMIECKSMSVPLSPAVLEQVLRYNISVPVPYLVITNGNNCCVFRKVEQQLEELDDLPQFVSSL